MDYSRRVIAHCGGGFFRIALGVEILWSPGTSGSHGVQNDRRAGGKGFGFSQRHNMSERYALFVDYGIPSGTPRLFLWDFRRKAIVASTYVMHGPGRGSTAKTPHFSNRPGSECSSLGRFLVTKERGHKIKRSFRLKGMDTDNQSAFRRGLMIHSARWVDRWCWKDYIPLNRVCCQGCVTISTRGMDYLWPLVNQERKPLLLWNFRSRNAVK